MIKTPCTTNPAIKLINVGLSYADSMVFANINLEIKANNWTAILGASGIGKSSLLRMIAGLTVDKEKIYGRIETSEKLDITKQVAYMAQTDLLLPWLNIIDNVSLGFKLRTHTHSERIHAKSRAQTLLQEMDLQHAAGLYPHQLSGGMRQRVALARTLIEDKPILLMDEPFSAVDTMTRFHLHELAVSLLKNKTVIFVTHDPAEATRLADEIYIMHGKPANLRHIKSLSSDKPRIFTAPDALDAQQSLYHELMLIAGESA